MGWAMRVEVQERGLMRWKGVEGWSLVASMVVVTGPSGGLEEPFPSGCSIGKEPSLSPSCSSSMTSIGGPGSMGGPGGAPISLAAAGEASSPLSLIHI